MAISVEKLVEKKEFYESKKEEIIAKDFTADIQAKVEDFRAEKMQEIEDFKAQKEQEIKDFETLTTNDYESERREDIKTCDHYIEFVNQLLEEEKSQEVVDGVWESTSEVGGV